MFRTYQEACHIEYPDLESGRIEMLDKRLLKDVMSNFSIRYPK